MAHVLFGNTTAIEYLDPDATAQFACDDHPTEQTPALTLEQPLFEEPLPIPATSEPVFLVEVRAPRAAPRLLAVRDSLEDAARIASSVHPGVADVILHEVPLPCDATSLASAMQLQAKSWARAPDGTWSPLLPTFSQ